MEFLSSGSRGIGPHLEMRWGVRGSSQVAMGIFGISRVAKMVSCLLPSCEGELAIALESLQGNQASSHVEGGIWWFLLSCGGNLGVPLELQQGPQGTSRVASGESGFLLSCEGDLGIALEWLQGNRASSQV